MGTQSKKEPRRSTVGMGIWIVLSLLASLPACGAVYVHRNWDDNSYFEMASHTLWHFSVGMLCVLVLDATLRWWHRWRFPILMRTIHLAVLWVPTVYLASVVEPWTALPLTKLSAQLSAPDGTAKPLSIASWNVFIQNHEFQTIQKTIESLDADVVLLLEVTSEHQKGLQGLSKIYPYSLWAPRSNTQGLAILSRVPGIKFRELVLGKSQMLAVEANIPAGPFSDKPIRMLGVHTASPNKHARFLVRDEQLMEIADWVNRSQNETVVIGDLNVTPWSEGFRSLLKKTGLVDTRRYRGFFATWPCGLGVIGIPIDHALVSQGLKIIDRECGFPSTDSDHQWIRTTVVGSKADRTLPESRDGNGKSSTAP